MNAKHCGASLRKRHSAHIRMYVTAAGGPVCHGKSVYSLVRQPLASCCNAHKRDYSLHTTGASLLFPMPTHGSGI